MINSVIVAVKMAVMTDRCHVNSRSCKRDLCGPVEHLIRVSFLTKTAVCDAPMANSLYSNLHCSVPFSSLTGRSYGSQRTHLGTELLHTYNIEYYIFILFNAQHPFHFCSIQVFSCLLYRVYLFFTSLTISEVFPCFLHLHLTEEV